MDLKKIIGILIIFLAVFSCLSIASAGWFDAPSDDEDTAPAKTIKLNITDSSFNVEKAIVRQAGNSFRISSDGSATPSDSTKVNATIDFSITVDISSLNESEKNSLKGNHTVKLTLDNNKTIDIGDAQFTVEGNQLIIKGSTKKDNVMSYEYDSDSKITKCEFSLDNINFIIGDK